MKLPKLPYSIPQAKSEIVQLQGINYSDNYAEGSLAESKNLSARRYPHISARRARERLTEHSNVTAITAWEKLVVVKDGQLWYGNACVGEVTAGEKQFAVINTKLVVFPDKKYVDLRTAVFKPSSEKISATGVLFEHNAITIETPAETPNVPFSVGDRVMVSGCTTEENNKEIEIKWIAKNPTPHQHFTILFFADGTFKEAKEPGEITITRQVMEVEFKSLEAKMTVTGASFRAAGAISFNCETTDWAQFSIGDSIRVSGCSKGANNKTAVIKAIMRSPIPSGTSFTELYFAENTFVEAEETGTITLTREIPDLDYICESENRIWGCSNKDRTIYASALGDPTNFYNYEDGISTCSYAVAVGSEGEFTGCCKLGSSVVFFKNNVLHKMLGGFPAEYTLYTYKMEGVAPNCHKSMQVVNGTLIYMSEHGVYSYSGGSSSLLSSVLGDRAFSDAVGGSDGLRYYLSVKEGDEHHLFTFDLKTGIWLHEDNTRVIDFARIGNALFYLDSEGNVYLADNGEEDTNVEWFAQFKPFYETTAGRKRHSKILLRAEMPASSWMRVEVRCDGGRWVEVGKIIGADADVSPFAVPINRCDKFEIRLFGKGPFAIMNIVRKFSIGGDS